MAWIKKTFWFEVPKPTDLTEYIGRHVKVTDDDHMERIIEIEKVIGSAVYPTKFEIISNGKHYLISILAFFAQMNGETVTPEEVAFFDVMSFEVQETPKFQRFKKGIWT